MNNLLSIFELHTDLEVHSLGIYIVYILFKYSHKFQYFSKSGLLSFASWHQLRIFFERLIFIINIGKLAHGLSCCS
jgi:hypothetical protein